VSYLGLHEHVRYRIEIGLAYIDDGVTVHRFDEGLFAELRTAIALPTRDGDPSAVDAVRIILDRFPSVFCAHEQQSSAQRSFERAELAAALADGHESP
jgi:hypothetical protein